MSSIGPPRSHEIVLRNALILVAAQALTLPLSVLINAVMARYIGPQDFGNLYLAQAFASAAFLFVGWGQGLTLPARVANDRSLAGELLGTGIAWRVGAATLAGLVLVVGSWVLGAPLQLRMAIALVVLSSSIGAVTSACQDTMRGFERTDFAAYGSVGQQLLAVLLIVPTLLLGGRLKAVLVAQTTAAAIMLLLVWRYMWPALRRSDVGKLSFGSGTLKGLLRQGALFLFFDLAMQLQSSVDAAFLSHSASAESVGWYAASRRLVGLLVYPASALIVALYPTLCRLYSEDGDGYIRTVRSGLRSATMLVVPVSLGCALFPEIGIRIFSRGLFGPAEDDLRILSIFVLLVYFSMVLGIALLAAGRQRSWAMVQFLCVLVSLALDPILVPWFQRRSHNGGLGVCVSSVASEVLMVGGGIWLAPKGVFGRSIFRELGLAALSGAAMVAAARLLSHVTPFVAAPLAVAAYVTCLWATGGLDKEQVEAIRGMIARKIMRRSLAPPGST